MSIAIARGLNTNGTGVVRFTTAPANNTTVSVLSNLPLSRSNNYQAGGSITAVSLEDDFDTTFMKLGDNAEKIQRVLKAPPSESTTADLTIPNATTRANKNLSFDANGEPTVSSSAISSASVSSTTTGSRGNVHKHLLLLILLQVMLTLHSQYLVVLKVL